MDKNFTIEELKIIKEVQSKASYLLSYTDQSEKSLRSKLADKGYPSYAIDLAIDFLKEQNYLNDCRFAENYIRSHLLTKSRFDLAEILHLKGIGSEDLEIAFSSVEQSDRAAVKAIFIKKYSKNDLTDRKTYEKALRYFSSHGFSYEDAKRGIQEAIDSIE